jgi:hypothetical protein
MRHRTSILLGLLRRVFRDLVVEFELTCHIAAFLALLSSGFCDRFSNTAVGRTAMRPEPKNRNI